MYRHRCLDCTQYDSCESKNRNEVSAWIKCKSFVQKHWTERNIPHILG